MFRLLLLLLLSVATVQSSEIRKWNSLLLSQIGSAKIPPPKAARDLALLHIAQSDAVNAITHFCEPYLRGVEYTSVSDVNAAAAAARAGHDILLSLFPALEADLDSALADSLSGVAEPTRTNSQLIGAAAASALLLNRSNDNSATPGSFSVPNPLFDGVWRPTPPAYANYLLPDWGLVTPFALDSGDQLRPLDGVPELYSEQYAAEMNEVMSLGGANSVLRNAEQTEAAFLWAADPGTHTPPGMWFDIAASLTPASMSLAEEARMYALLGIAVADAAIVAWDAKRTFITWRPVTVIRESGLDPTWSPLINTPPFPALISGHSTFSSTGASVLARLLPGGDSQPEFVVSSVGVSHSFTSLWQAAMEAGASRIYGGIHFQSDNQLGLSMGPQIADLVLAGCLRPLQTDSEALALAALSEAGVRRLEIIGASFWTGAFGFTAASVVILLAKTKE